MILEMSCLSGKDNYKIMTSMDTCIVFTSNYIPVIKSYGRLLKGVGTAQENTFLTNSSSKDTVK